MRTPATHCATLLAALAISLGGCSPETRPQLAEKPASLESVRTIVAPCISPRFTHLVQVAATEVADANYAAEARNLAGTCKAAGIQLAKLKAPAACVHIAEGMEIAYLALSKALSSGVMASLPDTPDNFDCAGAYEPAKPVP